MSVTSPRGATWNGTSFGLGAGAGAGGGESAVQSVYRNVTKGYDYTEGYHFLMKHMSRRCVFRFAFLFSAWTLFARLCVRLESDVVC